MVRRLLSLTAFGIMACSMGTAQTAGGMAQTTATPQSAAQPAGIAGEVQGNYARLKTNIVKAAEGMTAENYQFKPTPEVRSFARVVNHVTEAQLRVCGAANHTADSDLAKTPAETAGKDTIVLALKSSFAQCDKAYAGLSETNATELLDVFQSKRTRLGLLWGNVSHDNEQYATLALYMRLKGLVPPSSEK